MSVHVIWQISWTFDGNPIILKGYNCPFPVLLQRRCVVLQQWEPAVITITTLTLQETGTAAFTPVYNYHRGFTLVHVASRLNICIALAEAHLRFLQKHIFFFFFFFAGGGNWGWILEMSPPLISGTFPPLGGTWLDGRGKKAKEWCGFLRYAVPFQLCLRRHACMGLC